MNADEYRRAEMTAQEFKQVQSRLGLSNREMGEAILLSERMVEDMRAGRRRVTRQTERLIAYLNAGRHA